MSEIFCDIACELGEGSSWDEASSSVFWCDIVGRKLLERRFLGGPTTVHALPLMASAVAAIDGARQLLVTENGLFVRDRASGRLDLHTAIDAGRSEMRSNDARVHPCGALWTSTMAKQGSAKGAIYWFFKGELRKLYEDIATPNSICFSPDGRIAYYTDTRLGMLMRVECDPATGLPTSTPKVFADGNAAEGAPDGSVVDADGVLWNARWGGGGVEAWSPLGQRIRSIALGARQTTCPAFVGPNASRMVVTSARNGLSEAEREADPDAGKTFLVDMAFKGRFDPPVLI